MLALRRWEERHPTQVSLQLSPAQHNIPHASDRQNETAVMLNMVVDAAAKHWTAHWQSVGPRRETIGESLAVPYRQPANPDPYYFSIGSMALLGETRATAASAVGNSMMAATARRSDTQCGCVVELLVSGVVARTTTTCRMRLLHWLSGLLCCAPTRRHVSSFAAQEAGGASTSASCLVVCTENGMRPVCKRTDQGERSSARSRT